MAGTSPDVSLTDLLWQEGRWEPRIAGSMRLKTAARLLWEGQRYGNVTNGVERPVLVLTGKGKHRCTSPVVMVQALSEARSGPECPETLTRHVEMHVRCRKCDGCRNARSILWKMRAMREIEQSARTWFVTLTFTPDQQAKADYAAGLRLAANGVNEPSADHLFAERWRALSPQVTKWLKRVRNARVDAYVSPNPNDGGEVCQGWGESAFRYLMVVEEHKSQLPHVHLLIHEYQDLPLTKRRLTHTWVDGFSSAKLVGQGDLEPHKAAAYTCKYLSKSMLAKCRASQHYGLQVN